MAYREKCKGIAIYRYGSKDHQVLYLGGSLTEDGGEKAQYITANPEYAVGCVGASCPF